jgi:hypothetical protein
VLSSSTSTAYSWIHGLPLFDTAIPPPSVSPREFPQDAAEAAAAAAAAAAAWIDSVSLIAQIDVMRLRVRPMTIAQGGQVLATFNIEGSSHTPLCYFCDFPDNISKARST